MEQAVHLSALSPRYRAALEGAAMALRTTIAAVTASRGGGGGKKAAPSSSAAASPPPPPPPAGSALVLNLGPAWSSPSAYALFDDAVIELPFRDWEGPPGLCSPPLDVLFAAAEATSKWLSTSPDAVALLCVRARSGGGPRRRDLWRRATPFTTRTQGRWRRRWGCCRRRRRGRGDGRRSSCRRLRQEGAAPPRLQQQQQQQQQQRRGLPPLPPGGAEEMGAPSPASSSGGGFSCREKGLLRPGAGALRILF